MSKIPKDESGLNYQGTSLSEAELHKIKLLLTQFGIHDYCINHKDGSVDVYQDVIITDSELTHLPIKFNKAYKSFRYIDCPNLNSLKNSPDYVSENFSCSGHPLLQSLENGPKHVGVGYECNSCNLTSLIGSPTKMSENAHFRCSNNLLTSLVGAPTYLINSFEAPGNAITSDEGCPIVSNMLNLGWNQLTELKNIDLSNIRSLIIRNNLFDSLESIKGLSLVNSKLWLYAQYNRLTSLKGSPQKCLFLDLGNNQISSMEGAPMIVSNGLSLDHNLLENFEQFPKIRSDGNPQIVICNNPIYSLGVLDNTEYRSKIFKIVKIKEEIKNRLKIKYIRENLK